MGRTASATNKTRARQNQTSDRETTGCVVASINTEDYAGNNNEIQQTAVNDWQQNVNITSGGGQCSKQCKQAEVVKAHTQRKAQ